MLTVEESLINQTLPLFFLIYRETKVMVTTGYPSSSATKTEVVDVVTVESCADLADFPLENRGAVAANLHGTPVVCGGHSSAYYQACYKYTNTGWQQFASMKEERGVAAATGDPMGPTISLN